MRHLQDLNPSKRARETRDEQKEDLDSAPAEGPVVSEATPDTSETSTAAAAVEPPGVRPKCDPSNMTVKQLRAELKARDISLTGLRLKKDLQQRLYQSLEEDEEALKEWERLQRDSNAGEGSIGKEAAVEPSSENSLNRRDDADTPAEDSPKPQAKETKQSPVEKPLQQLLDEVLDETMEDSNPEDTGWSWGTASGCGHSKQADLNPGTISCAATAAAIVLAGGLAAVCSS